jgi:transposase
MTEIEQRKAIAESIGWEWVKVWEQEGLDPVLRGHPPRHLGDPQWAAVVPFYPEDLDAMHDVVAALQGFEVKKYVQELMEVCQEHPVGCVPDYHADLLSLARITQATAAQKAEAYLRALGLWTTS